MTTFADTVFQLGGMPILNGVPAPFTGKWWWVNPASGSDDNSGTKPTDALGSLYGALNHAVAGRNDVIALMSDGTTATTARLSLANAQLTDPTATAGTLVWNKNATHLVGVCSPVSYFQRARIAPPTGTYTAATFGSPNFVTVTASGCYFYNFSVFAAFSTGSTTGIAWTDTGSRNAYVNCHLMGLADAASAGAAGARTLKIGASGSGELDFYRCTIGTDTVTRTAANSTLEFAGGTPRNRFTECVFPFAGTGSASGMFGILGTGNDCVDRHQIFDRCLFVNNIKSGGFSTMTALGSFTTNAPGGLVVFKDCDTVGITKIGDTNFLANSYVSNVGGASTGGLDVNPS